jgi:preprotein translocase subunit SecB
MTDAPTPPAAGGNGPQPSAPALVVKAQYVKDLSFENPRAPQSLMSGPVQPEIQIAINVSVQRLAESDYEVGLKLTADAKLQGEPLFTVELLYAGVMAVGQIPQEHIRPFLMIEGPRILFPFARNIVADAVRDGGFPPLFLQPVDFVELYRREMNAAQQQARAAAPTTLTPQ